MNNWISVDKGLPDIDQKVLVYAKCTLDGFTNDTKIAITSLTDVNPLWPSLKLSKPKWKDPWLYFFMDYEITHWMPLPEPPKEKNND